MSKNPEKARESVRRVRERHKTYAPEKTTEAYLVAAVKARGGLCPKFVDPGRRGAPDRLVLLPGHPTYYVELKRAKSGKLQPWQARYHEDIRAAGGRVDVLWSKEDVDGFFATL